MTEERKQELDREWDLSDQMDDEAYQEWYDGLTDEEQALIDTWDKQYRQGVRQICDDMLKESRKPCLENQIVAAKAQQLRQRAERLPGTHGIVQELRGIEEAARKPRGAEEGHAKGNDLANALSVLEAHLKAREAQLKQEQKDMHAAIDAAEDLTATITR